MSGLSGCPRLSIMGVRHPMRRVIILVPQKDNRQSLMTWMALPVSVRAGCFLSLWIWLLCWGIGVRRHLKVTTFRHSLVCRRSRHSISAPVSCIPVGCGDGQKSVSPVVSVADCSLSVAFVLSSFVVNAEITTFNTLLLILSLFIIRLRIFS